MTNNHVIEGADEIVIEFREGLHPRGRDRGHRPQHRHRALEGRGRRAAPFVPFGDSDAMRVGDWVMAMGNPLGQGFSVSVGIVSASAAPFRAAMTTTSRPTRPSTAATRAARSSTSTAR